MSQESEAAPRPVQSTSLDKLLPALHEARKAMSNPTKEKDNSHFKSKYADLAACKEAGDEALAAQGLFVNDIRTNDGHGYEELVTTLWHAASGQFLRAYTRLAPVKADPQGYGSAMTFARRYAYLALLGLAPEDDDGNDASGVKPVGTQSPSAPARPAAPPPPSVANPVFGGDPQLITFQESVRTRFRSAKSADALTAAWQLLEPDLKALKVSPEPLEANAAKSLRQDYLDRLAELTTKPAPTPTVSGILGGDSVPF